MKVTKRKGKSKGKDEATSDEEGQNVGNHKERRGVSPAGL
jgi:hypothetical protein